SLSFQTSALPIKPAPPVTTIIIFSIIYYICVKIKDIKVPNQNIRGQSGISVLILNFTIFYHNYIDWKNNGFKIICFEGSS
ncbi:MAG: hypothetical protein Q8T08_07410, partial [Ignavibacteria bacterium]|nr:hypothetical protein [Ignavibacteria bacterium]